MVDRTTYFKEYYQVHKDNLLPRSREWKETHLGYQRERVIKIKTETLTHYGNGKCACVNCGESRLDCLSLDHINNNGAEERRQWFGENWSSGGGVASYRKLQKLNYPDGYQTLCMNCQWIKRAESQTIGKY